MDYTSGSYQFDGYENLDEFYDAIGTSWIYLFFNSLSPTLHASVEKDANDKVKVVNIKLDACDWPHEMSFKIGQVVKDNVLGVEDVFDTFVTMDGANKLVLKSRSTEGINMTRIFNFTREGVLITYKTNKGTREIEARKYFGRIR